GETQAALAGERGCLQQRAVLVAGAGKTDADFMASEDRVLALGRRVLLVEDLALPAAVRAGVAADIIERRVAAEDTASLEQHHASEAAVDAIEQAQMDGVEAVDDAAL